MTMISANDKQPRGGRLQLVQAAIFVLGVFTFVYWTAVMPGTASAGATDRSAPAAFSDEEFSASSAPELAKADETALEPGSLEESAEGDYSRFRHTDPSHGRLPCLLCHRREDNSTRLTFPGKAGHAPCAGCHAPQMQDQGSKICTICHSNPGTGAMKAFPPLRSFTAKFNHAKHLRHTNCGSCHTPTRNGVALSEPRGRAAHASCFQCHTNTSPLGSCDTCHSPGRPSRFSDTARSYSLNFSHREHTRRMNCTSCHTVLAGSARGRQVTKPTGAMHFASARGTTCATCHNDRRAFGSGNFANCKRCHEGSSFRFR